MMDKLNCNVIRDILPLYADEVVSQDTRCIVEEHLEVCESCKHELDGFKRSLAIPLDVAGDGALHQIKKWGQRKFWKGIAITLGVLTVFVGLFLWAYGYGVSVDYEDTVIRTGFQCAVEYDENANRVDDSSRQVWILDYGVLEDDGTYGEVRDTTKYVYDSEKRIIGVTIFVRKALVSMPWNYKGTIRAGYSLDPEAVDTSEDFTVTLVFADREVTYSLREEGIFDLSLPHSAEFCPFCAEKQK